MPDGATPPLDIVAADDSDIDAGSETMLCQSQHDAESNDVIVATIAVGAAPGSLSSPWTALAAAARVTAHGTTAAGAKPCRRRAARNPALRSAKGAIRRLPPRKAIF